jgi:hypothetical protein
VSIDLTRSTWTKDISFDRRDCHCRGVPRHRDVRRPMDIQGICLQVSDGK